LHDRTVDAERRRLKFELGIDGVELKLMLSDFRYRAEKGGVVENEICPVFVGLTDRPPKPNPDEVEAVKWIDWGEFCAAVTSPETDISPWAVEEVELLNASGDFREVFSGLTFRS